MPKDAMLLIHHPHKYLTRDLPTGVSLLWDVRVPVLIALTMYFMTLGAPCSYIFIIIQVGTVVAGRHILKRVGVLSSSSLGHAPLAVCNTECGAFVCRGDTRELEALRAIEDRACQPFSVHLSPFSVDEIEWLAVIGGAFSSAFLLHVVGAGYGLTCVVVLCFMVVLSAFRHYWPWYHRVDLQGLETMRFTLLSSKPRTQEVVSLHNAGIICRYDRRTLDIYADRRVLATPSHRTGSVDHEQRTVTVDLSRVSHPHALVQAVFHRALCPHDALQASTGDEEVSR